MTQEDDQKAHAELERLKGVAGDQVPQIVDLETRFGPQGALKITGGYDANVASKAPIVGTGEKVGDWHVREMMQDLQGRIGDKPTAQQTALQTELQNAIKKDPQLVDRLEAALKKDPKLADALEVRYINNPDGVKAQLANLAKPDADIGAVVNGVAPKPGTVNTAKFDLNTELGKVDPGVKDGVKKLFDAMMANADIKKAFDELKNEDEKRDLIQHLGKAAKADPKFLDNATEIVKNKPQLVASSMEYIAEDNDTAGAFNRASTPRTRPGGQRPGGPDQDNSNNPLGNFMSMIGDKMGPLLGRIANVFMKMIEGILGFFENMFGGGTNGVSTNSQRPVVSQLVRGATMGQNGPQLPSNVVPTTEVRVAPGATPGGNG